MDEHYSWNFPEETSSGDTYVDPFADTKFSIDKWVSFTREIIQNSLDAQDEELTPPQPVSVVMRSEDIPLDEIPGGHQIVDCLQKAKERVEAHGGNHQTVDRYNAGLDLLEQDQVRCFKVSDYRTVGVHPGREDAWGALVYDEGNSKKRRKASAGSHGVGKKAPFLISMSNTVFYNTVAKTESADPYRLFQGRMRIVNWDSDDGKTMRGDGFFGRYDNTQVRRNRDLPIEGDIIDQIVPSFFRRDKELLGTDVVMVGVNLDDFENIKKHIALSALENFFVAIDRGYLELDVFGQTIDKKTLSFEIENAASLLGRKNFKIFGTEKYGNLRNYYKAYQESPTTIDVSIDGVVYGRCNIHFLPENDRDKKFYCLFRTHGMKIYDRQVTDADQPFTAVVVLDDDGADESLSEDERLNAILGDTENAAHNEFVVDDPAYPCSPLAKRIVDFLNTTIENFIREKTKIDIEEEAPLGGLEDMISIPGFVRPTVSERKPQIRQKKKKKIKKRGMGRQADDYEQGVGDQGGLHPKPNVEPKPGENKPAQPGNERKATLYYDFAKRPTIVHAGSDYIIRLATNDTVNADIVIRQITVDGNLTTIPDIVLSARVGEKFFKVEGNTIKDVPLNAAADSNITIRLVENFDYSLDCDLYVKERS